MNRLGLVLLIGGVAALVAVPGAVRAQCAGDCSGDGKVTIDELVRAVDIVLGTSAVSSCTAVDTNQDGVVTVDEVVAAVNHAMVGCGGGSLSDLQIPNSFDYATTREVALDLTVCTPNGHPFPSVPVMILAPSAQSKDVLWTGITDLQGHFGAQVQVPARFDALRVVVSAPGVVNDAVLPLVGGQVIHQFGCGATATSAEVGS